MKLPNKYHFYFLICVFNFQYSFSQFQFNYQDSIPVSVLGAQLKLPWAGGLNYAQFSDIDVDFDGDMDLFVFDRSANQVRVFVQQQNAGTPYYQFNPLLSDKFPPDLRYRTSLLDYNGDGKNDLFTYGIGGIKVYKNVGNVASGLQWELSKELLYSNYWGQMLNLYVSSSDIPALVDVDNDGDVDVLTYHIGGEHLQYHQNQSMDLYGHSDSLEFELKNECWGGYKEDFSTNTVYLNDNSSVCSSGNVPNPEINQPDKPFAGNNSDKMHAGSTVLAIDIDGSGVKDLILGDVSYSNLTLLINGGSAPNTNSLMISSDASFPSNSTPVNLYLFPAAFNVDVDFDNVKDLIICPNAKNVSNNEHSVLKYINTGSNTSSNFVFSTTSFLQQDMIEHGSGSIPVFCDINSDGLEDMFVANFFAYKDLAQKESRIAYYQNTGTTNNPVFTLIDNDFLNLSQLSLGLRMAPTFGDINGDNLPDLFLGLENGSIAYMQNTSVGSSVTFASAILNYQDQNGTNISVGQFASPQLFDLNQDGKLDLIIGNKTGELVYYMNNGTLANASFEFIQNNLGGVDVQIQSINGYSTPNFFKYNDTIYLMVGTYDGDIHFYDQISSNLGIGDSFNNISSEFLGINVGAYSSPFVIDIDNDGDLNLFLGQDLGGISHLEHDSSSNLSTSTMYVPSTPKLYPNPCMNVLHLLIDSDLPEGSLAYVLNYEGRVVHKMNVFTGDNLIPVEKFQNGVYLIKIDGTLKPLRFIKK